jgi:L,D-transpeptidase ErfK/SrfK
MALMARWPIVAISCVVAAAGVPAAPGERLARVALQHTVAARDSLRSVGSRYGIDPSVLAADNARSARAPVRIGEQLVVAVAHIVPAIASDRVLTINVPQRMLYFRTPEGLLAFPVAVGSAG